MAGATPRVHSERQPNSWAEELKAYEKLRRYEVDPGLFKGPTVAIGKGELARRELEYNPLLGRFRNPQKEIDLQRKEHEVTAFHLNRAKDVQLKREAHHDIVTHEDKLGSIYPRNEFMPSDFGDHNKCPFPTSTVDYNIVSNLPFSQHHWARPDQRPHDKERSPKQRRVSALQHKDFNVLTNRYHHHHEDKVSRDRALELREAAEKCRTTSTFNPLTQRFCNDQMEQRVRACEDAREVESRLRAEGVQPLSYRGNVTQSYDLLSHEVKDADLLHFIRSAEESRTARFKTRHAVEENTRQKDVSFQEASERSKMEQVSYERYQETARKGYDIVTNQRFGNGPKDKNLYKPLTKPKPDIWQQAEHHYTFHGDPTTAPYQASKSTRRSREVAPEDVQTLKLPVEGPPLSGTLSARGSRSSPVQASGGSRAMSARGTPNTSGSSRTRESFSASRSAQPPPAPRIPGSPGGSVYSRSLRAPG